MRTRVAFLLLSLVLFREAGAQAPIELADGRRDEPFGDLAAWAARPPMQQALAAARAYWHEQDPGYEEEVRVFAVAEGAFTEPGTVQQAVLFRMAAFPLCCPKRGLAIIEGDRLIRNVAFVREGQALSAVPDLDGDGRDELVYTTFSGQQGYVDGLLTLVSFGADGLTEWGSAGIYTSDCNTAREGASSSASRVFVVPGPETVFVAESYTQPDCETWQPAGEPKPIELDPYTGDGVYVDLPVQAPSEATADGSSGTRHERGQLTPGDETLASGEYSDEYVVEGRRGQTLVIDLRSTDFDPYLILALPTGEQIDNDDHEGDQTHSQISISLAETGTYRVIVTSYAAGDTGAYDLTIRVGGDSE